MAPDAWLRHLQEKRLQIQSDYQKLQQELADTEDQRHPSGLRLLTSSVLGGVLVRVPLHKGQLEHRVWLFWWLGW